MDYPANVSECDRFSAITVERKNGEYEDCIKLILLYLYLNYLRSIPQILYITNTIETQYTLWCSGKGHNVMNF